MPVEECIVRADFDDLEAFLDEIRRKLPEFFKASVAVEDSADVLCRVIRGDSEIVCHNCFLLLSGKFFDGAVCIRQPDFVDVMQDIVVGFIIVAFVALPYLIGFLRIFPGSIRVVLVYFFSV